MGMKIYTRREFLRAAGLGLAAAAASQTIRISDALGAADANIADVPSAAKLPSPIKGIVSVDSKPRAGIAVSDG